MFVIDTLRVTDARKWSIGQLSCANQTKSKLAIFAISDSDKNIHTYIMYIYISELFRVYMHNIYIIVYRVVYTTTNVPSLQTVPERIRFHVTGYIVIRQTQTTLFEYCNTIIVGIIYFIFVHIQI